MLSVKEVNDLNTVFYYPWWWTGWWNFDDIMCTSDLFIL